MLGLTSKNVSAVFLTPHLNIAKLANILEKKISWSPVLYTGLLEVSLVAAD